MSKLQRKLQNSSCESSLTSPKSHHVGDNGSNNNSSFRTQSKASKQPKNHHIKASSQDPKKHHVTDNSTKALHRERSRQTDRQTDSEVSVITMGLRIWVVQCLDFSRILSCREFWRILVRKSSEMH
jgi:hypothetical protein